MAGRVQSLFNIEDRLTTKPSVFLQNLIKLLISKENELKVTYENLSLISDNLDNNVKSSKDIILTFESSIKILEEEKKLRPERESEINDSINKLTKIKDTRLKYINDLQNSIDSLNEEANNKKKKFLEELKQIKLDFVTSMDVMMNQMKKMIIKMEAADTVLSKPEILTDDKIISLHKEVIHKIDEEPELMNTFTLIQTEQIQQPGVAKPALDSSSTRDSDDVSSVVSESDKSSASDESLSRIQELPILDSDDSSLSDIDGDED